MAFPVSLPACYLLLPLRRMWYFGTAIARWRLGALFCFLLVPFYVEAATATVASQQEGTQPQIMNVFPTSGSIMGGIFYPSLYIVQSSNLNE